MSGACVRCVCPEQVPGVTLKSALAQEPPGSEALQRMLLRVMSDETRASLHHLAIGTRNVERLAAFYRDTFDLTECARHYYSPGNLRSVWLALSGSLLMIEHTEEEPRSVQGVGFGPFLIAFAIRSEHRKTLELKLTSAGCPIESRSPYTSYARDLDGNRIAISHYPALGLDQLALGGS